jgi:tRNA threonylcarbamoyladenosine biosynthesis protein TsaB
VLGRGHAERLVPMIAALPDKGRADRIAVALGPGSFHRCARRAGRGTGAGLCLGGGTGRLPDAGAGRRDGARKHPGQAIAVAMTGGHGEWFVQPFNGSGEAQAPLTSLSPEQAAAQCQIALVAGSQAEALVTLRGTGTALALLPDARAFTLLRPADLTADTAPLYGRGPDARLPGVAA